MRSGARSEPFSRGGSQAMLDVDAGLRGRVRAIALPPPEVSRAVRAVFGRRRHAESERESHFAGWTERFVKQATETFGRPVCHDLYPESRSVIQVSRHAARNPIET